jgi:hypothetical protein
MSAQVPREKAVFCQALEITDPEQRRQFLDQACGADQALREQVEKLLGLSQSAGDFFTECRPALEAAAADADPAQVRLAAAAALEAESHETKRIGPYKLLQKIGEGGGGVVYMAEQEQPFRRRVALKIIKLGMDTKNVIARFEAERQALALMDHPNIARVLDAGATETGRPFFVMELVYGVKITDYCDQMSLHQLGQKDLARSELEKARDIIDNRFQTELDQGSAEQGYWFDWVYAHILLREATDLIEGAPKLAKRAAR